MRHLLLCFALLTCLATGALAASEPPVHDCLEGGSMDYTPLDTAKPAPDPGA